ncbi:MAG: deoxyribodipyrimidine photo-lyase [Gammaproteobacteria bacterium]|jgi:deoxyribodipyrimidine photo-lyase
MSKFLSPIIVWLRRDFRIHDNRALAAAVSSGKPVLLIFIFDEHRSSKWFIGSASRCWLHNSLESFSRELNNKVCLQKGDTDDVLKSLVRETGAQAVFWNKIYEPEYLAADSKTEQMLGAVGVETSQFTGSYLYPPRSVLKDDQTPYRVFTAFYKKHYASQFSDFEESFLDTKNLKWFSYDNGLSLDELLMMPSGTWPNKFNPYWQPGELGAQRQLESFINGNYSPPNAEACPANAN